MRYNAFFGELPLDAFKPIGGKMSLHGGGNPMDVVNNAIEGVGNIGQSAVDAVADVGRSVDQTVRDVVPGGWTGAALLAAGAYYAPEMGAWLDSSGSVVAGSEGVAAPTAAEVASAGSTGTGLAATGSEGLAGGATTNLASMGGAQGLTGATTAGTVAGAEGGTLAAGGLGSGIGLSGAGAAGAGTSALSGLLPTSALGQAALVSGGLGLAQGYLQSQSAKKAADVQSAAAQGATALQGQMFNTINQQEAPYRSSGYGALNQIGQLSSGPSVQYDAAGNQIGTTTGSGYLTHQFDKNDLTNGLAPNYDFMLGQGQMANQRAANAGGGALGGNALQGLNKYTQDYAGNAYQNAFTNYQNQRSNIYNTLAGIAGIGQTGQTATNTAGTNATNAASQLGVGSAAAQAAGMTGTANAYGNALSSVGNNYMLASLLNQNGRVG